MCVCVRGADQIIYESSNSKPKADEYAEQTQSNKVRLMMASDAERDLQLVVVSAGANGVFFFCLPVSSTSTKEKKKQS